MIPIIEYRDFWDVPRVFLVEYGDEFYVLDSPFDVAADDFEPRYRIYRIDSSIAASMRGQDWSNIGNDGVLVGFVDVAKVQFDPSRRSAVAESLFSEMQQEPNTDPDAGG